MLVRDVNLQSGYITITDPSDVLMLNNYDMVAFQLKCPTFFINCTFNNSMGVLPESSTGKNKNAALQIKDLKEIDSEKYCIITDATFNRCYFPVIINGRNCEILYSKPILTKQENEEEFVIMEEYEEKEEELNATNSNRKIKLHTSKTR